MLVVALYLLLTRLQSGPFLDELEYGTLNASPFIDLRDSFSADCMA